MTSVQLASLIYTTIKGGEWECQAYQYRVTQWPRLASYTGTQMQEVDRMIMIRTVRTKLDQVISAMPCDEVLPTVLMETHAIEQ